ncbi:MAG: hypothetical protein NTV58_15055 [Deltaproteobacteria bacterium]|nr:hypothetical protein [Deltaproteobacteria bacterium]
MKKNSKSEDLPGVDGVGMDDLKDIIWKCRLKLQILTEFFYDADSCPDFENYQAWAEGVTLLLTEIIEAQEEVHSRL